MRRTAISQQELWDRESKRYGHEGLDISAWPFSPAFLPQRGETILDAGCGAGNYLSILRDLSDTRYGVDISPKMIAQAGRFGSCRLGNIERLDFPSASVDYVLSINVINHCEQPEQALAELARVCRPGGHVLIAVPNQFSFLTGLRKVALSSGTYRLGRCRHFSAASLSRESARHGLRPIAFDIWNRPPACHTPLRQLAAEVGHWLDLLVHRRLASGWGEILVAYFERSRA